MTNPRGRIGLLYTYADATRSSMQRATYAEHLNIPIVWDSGAWSVHTGRATINLNQHTAWIKHRQTHGSNARYISLDVIGSPEQTHANHHAQRNAGVKADATIHYGTPPNAIDTFNHTTEWINVGGIAGMTRGHAPIRARAFAETITAAAHAQGLRVHGLGATHPTVTKRVPFDGIDSTFWMSGARYGLLPLFDPGTGDWRRLHYRTRNPTTRTRGWQAIHENGRWLRETYAITPAELNDATDERIRDLSIASHRNYADWLAHRHQRPVIVYLAGATGIPEAQIERIANGNKP
jgi:hypothetical protein